jgi:hypothetical protein
VTSLRPSLTVQRARDALLGGGRVLLELALLAGAVAFLEVTGAHSPSDGVDLLGLAAALTLGLLLARRARRGWMPVTTALWLRARQAFRRTVARWTPKQALGLRPTPGVPTRRDPALLGLGRACALVCVAAVLLGPLLLDGVAWVKAEVSYVVYLALLGTLWSALAGTILLGGFALSLWLRERHGPNRPPPATLTLALLVLWIGALALFASVPGWVPLAAVLLLAGVQSLRLHRAPARGYLFCRRDAAGAPMALTAEASFRRLYAVLALAAAAAVALGQSPRLFSGAWPTGPFAFTTWLGVLASLCAAIVVVRTGAHMARVLGVGAPAPETPLEPTIWVPGALPPDAVRWIDIARAGGFTVVRGEAPPPGGYDLVVDGGPSVQRLVPPEDDLPDDEILFRLRRRLDVSMRRVFHRRLKTLFKTLKRRGGKAGGTGFVFAPHVWLLPGVVRDAEVGGSARERVGGPTVQGPPYADAFPLRVRRYVGGILRRLEVDMIYWEDSVSWGDLRRVLGVVYEMHDQGRLPLEARHFLGLPRVRVLVEEDDAEPVPPAETPATRAAAHNRNLIVLRDRGEEEDATTLDPKGTREREPLLV